MTAATNPPVRLDVTRLGGAAVVKINGSVSLADADGLRRRLEDLAAERVPVIVLDLSDMDFISSLGLGAIISGHLKCRHHQGEIRLVGPTPPVRQLLETTRLTQLFSVHDSLEQAVANA